MVVYMPTEFLIWVLYIQYFLPQSVTKFQQERILVVLSSSSTVGILEVLH